jgi:hypothetical protein
MLDRTRQNARYTTTSFLSDTRVRRGGVTAKYWYGSTDSVLASRPEDATSQPRALVFSFNLPSKGGGDTAIEMRVGPKDFPVLLAYMSAVDREATLKAIAEELRYQICDTPTGEQNSG